MDENFCKNPERAGQLLEQMEKHGKAYSFSAFSSAETITKLGTDFLLRLGINFIWIGVESKANLFEKTQGIDLRKLISDLQDHGISVLASSILFLEHHDKETIHEDIDWAIELESDLLQFMELGPNPGTRLYHDYESSGKIIKGIPWSRKHGQDEIWFHHQHFSLPETASYLRDAFIKKYLMHGPAVLSMAMTAIKGYTRVKAEIAEREKSGMVWDPSALTYVRSRRPVRDEFMHLRLESVKRNALRFRPALGSTLRYAPNAKAAEKCREAMALFHECFGPMIFSERMKSLAVRLLAAREIRRMKKEGVIMRQPPTNRITYPDRAEASQNEDYLPAETLLPEPSELAVGQ
jgi:hypothetical protein